MSAEDVVKVQLTKVSALQKMLIADNVKSHFQAIRLSGKVNTAVDDDPPYFLGALGSDNIDSLHIGPWKTNCLY